MPKITCNAISSVLKPLVSNKGRLQFGRMENFPPCACRLALPGLNEEHTI